MERTRCGWDASSEAMVNDHLTSCFRYERVRAVSAGK